MERKSSAVDVTEKEVSFFWEPQLSETFLLL